jgi:hypothetical protein
MNHAGQIPDARIMTALRPLALADAATVFNPRVREVEDRRVEESELRMSFGLARARR